MFWRIGSERFCLERSGVEGWWKIQEDAFDSAEERCGG